MYTFFLSLLLRVGYGVLDLFSIILLSFYSVSRNMKGVLVFLYYLLKMFTKENIGSSIRFNPLMFFILF